MTHDVRRLFAYMEWEIGVKSVATDDEHLTDRQVGRSGPLGQVEIAALTTPLMMIG